MNALREIVDVKNNQVVIELPQNFQQRKVEVIILSLDTDEDVIKQEHLYTSKKVDYGQYFGITNIGQETIDRQLKLIRDEWERTCI